MPTVSTTALHAHEPVSFRLVEIPAGFVRYVGGLAIVAGATILAPLQRRRDEQSLTAATAHYVEHLIVLGMPLLALLHMAFGSVLAMQAFFRATFPETNGAVVGVAMMRSVAPLLTGIFVSIVMSIRAIHELPSLREDPDAQEDFPIGRMVFTRVAAAMLASPVLALWGAGVGTVIGCLVSKRILGVASGTYFGFLFEMLQTPDVLGLAVLSMAYSGVATLIACHEALRRSTRVGAIPLGSAYRAVVVSLLAILALNSLWFSMVYLPGGPLAPTVGISPANPTLSQGR